MNNNNHFICGECKTEWDSSSHLNQECPKCGNRKKLEYHYVGVDEEYPDNKPIPDFTTDTKDDKYSFACSNCGYDWHEHVNKTKACPVCGTIDIVCSYQDGDLMINDDEYKSIINNNERTTYKCKCGYEKKLYGEHMSGIMCDECFNFMEVQTKAEDYQKIKLYRLKKKMSQAAMAKKIGLSQAQYSRIEAGKKRIPYALQKVAMR